MGEDVDERSDIYSLGVLLYEMLTGDVPFHGETMVAVAMKHVNEDLPNIQLMRPQVSSALAAVIERATAKDPRRRYRHLAEMLDDLENALEVEVSRSGPSHGEVTSVLESVPRQRRLLEGRGASRAGVVMGAIGLALIVVVIAVTGGGVRGGGTISLRAHSAHSFDPPPGDGTEHPEATGLAVDGNPSGTPWQTETYPAPDFGGIKDGVGLYLDVGKEVQAHSMQVRTPVSGWSAELRAASGSSPPTSLNDWKIVGGSESVKSGDKIDIEAPGDYRFYMLWITRLAPAEGGYRVTVNDIKLGR
jgi:serine/threonine-protein kinase